jgi:hypothetical protein
LQSDAGSNQSDYQGVIMAKANLTAERLREVLSYDAETGKFHWIRCPSNRVKVGNVAGSIDGYGYRMIGVDGSEFGAHRLAFLFQTGNFPLGQADHINGVRDDNRWVNLRDVTAGENLQNIRRARSSNSTGVLGAHRHQGRWRARIQSDGKFISLGCFDTPEEAHQAYVTAKRLLHAGCTI